MKFRNFSYISLILELPVSIHTFSAFLTTVLLHVSAHYSLFDGHVALWWVWKTQMDDPKVDEARRCFPFCCVEME